MSGSLYDVVFDGVIEGFDEAQAKAAFAELFKVDAERVDRLFSAPGNLIKGNLAEDLADKYIAKLASVGVRVVKKSQAIELDLVPKEPTELSVESVQEMNADSAIDQAFNSQTETTDAPVRKSKRIVEFQFFGQGFEYFKIWIVNILLTILTLGIYSAWAKVRNKQYFYGNTQLDGAAFEYTAEPLKVLKGRIIAVVFFAAYSYCLHYLPIVGFVLALVLLVFTPWIVVMSLRFNARHTSYRNIPFQFVGSIGGAFKSFVLWPIAGIFSLFLLMPFAWRSQATYVTANHKYGTEPFKFDIGVGTYYKIMGILIGATVIFFVALAAIAGSAFKGVIAQDPASMIALAPKMLPIFGLYLAFYFLAGAYFITAMANAHFNNMAIQDHRFESDWSTGSYAALLFTNTIGIGLTLGLFIPFARIRMAHYKAQHTHIYATETFDDFIADQSQNANSVGEGFHDIFDIDISL